MPDPHADGIGEKNPMSDQGADISGQISCGYKCQKKAILDQTSDSIKQGSDWSWIKRTIGDSEEFYPGVGAEYWVKESTSCYLVKP